MTAGPSSPVDRVAVRLTKDALRQVRGGHPWVFDASVISVRPDGQVGDLAVVFDDDRRFAAIGLWDPGSPIRVRVLHRGSPRTVDGAFWREQLSAALGRRTPLLDQGDTDAYRWVAGENDGLPGLVVDRYADVAVVKLYSAAWMPHLDAVVAALVDVAAEHTDPVGRVVLRMARTTAAAPRRPGTEYLDDGSALVGELPTEPVQFVEHGLAFEADVVHGQKTGHFLDQRDNRLRVRHLAAGGRVLDVFCCTGGFSVNAAAGGATLVHSVDLSPQAVATARRNLAYNSALPEVGACTHRATVGDAYEVMEQLAAAGETYDVVVVDPPSFASRKEQVAGAVRAYARLTGLSLELVAPSGTLLQASCSARIDAATFERVVTSAAADAGRPLRNVQVLGHALDHPVGFPQGEYLCAVLATVD
ncbi:MAG: class I SAM-dependent rRNA methyltransferase [Actinomycetes bacterium]